MPEPKPETPDPPDQTAVQVAHINARQIILVTVITAISGVVGAVIQGVFSSQRISGLQASLSQSDEKIGGLQDELNGPAASVAERKALYRLTADFLEDDMRLTSGKGELDLPPGLSEDELDYRRLKRAVFLNLDALRANDAILKTTIDELQKRGHGWVAQQEARLMAALPQLKAAKLRWLEDWAIPTLQRTMDEIGVRQSIPSAVVPLPQEAWILDHEPDDPPTITIRNMTALKEEARLIKQSL